MEERTLFQKIILVVLAAMMAVFGIVTAFNQTRPGIEFRDGFLRRIEVTDADGFSGKVEGEEVTLLIWYDADPNTTGITLQVGGRNFDSYSVYLGEPMIPLQGTVASITSTALQVPTVRVTKNDVLIYEGGWQASSRMFFTSEGEFDATGLDMTIRVSGEDPWKDYTMSKGLLMELALGPELVTRGNWGLYAVAVLLTLAMMADVAFPYTLFRWRYHWWVKDPEPTDDYMSMQHLAWVICPILLLVFYIAAATTLM